MPPAEPHPLDLPAAYDLRRLDSQAGAALEGASRIPARLVWRQWMLAVETGVRFILEAALLLLRKGASRCEPARCRVASPNYGLFLFVDHHALAALEKRIGGPVVILIERPNLREQWRGRAHIIDPNDLPVPRSAWFRHVLAPGLRLVAELLVLSLVALRDARCLELVAQCLWQARYSLAVWRIAFNVVFDYYLDVSEYGAEHYVKAIVFSKFARKLVRLPHSQMDTSALGYLGHDAFLSGGSYQAEEYGASWSPRTRSISVGLMRNVQNGFATVDPELVAVIEAHVRADGRLAVFFTPGKTEWFGGPALTALRGLLRAVGDRRDWLVVIKPKGERDQAFYGLVEEEPELAGWLASPRVAPLWYRGRFSRGCTARWLIDLMAFGVSLGGSVQVEGLTRGVPIFAYWPVWHETPYKRKLAGCGLLHVDAGALEAALRRYIDKPGSFDIPYDWFRERFDPFSDDRALERVAEVLLADPNNPDGKDE
jgi:hypothetical protein